MREPSIAVLGVLLAGVACCAKPSGFMVGQGELAPEGAGSSSSGGGFEADGGVGSASFPSPLQPTFGPTVTAAVPPPAISGGTMLVTHDGTTVVVADSARDLVYVVDVASRTLLQTITLQAGDEPGRVAEDGAGRVHVALRGSGALVTLDPASGDVLARRAVCPAPRGVAWDGTTDSVIVACATGELVTLPSAGGAPTRTVTVERDLRDVLVQDGAVSVSSFRSSELLDLASDGSVAKRVSMASSNGLAQVGNVTPQVAWRTLLDAAGDTVVLHQVHSDASISTTVPGGYGGAGGVEGPPGLSDAGGADSGGTPIVLADLTVLGPDGSLLSDTILHGAAVAVDVAISPDGAHALVAAAGNAFSPLLQTALYFTIGSVDDSLLMPQLPGPAVAVAFDAAGEALVQTLDPATLWIVTPGTAQSTPIPLSSLSRTDSGNNIFHTQAGAMVACASCHPEGGDDGHVWTFDGDLRRTASLRGTILGTAPYHWPGDMPDFPTLVVDVYTVRMSGTILATDAMTALQGWVESIPAPPAPSWVDPSAAQRGQVLFEGAGCTSCHSGTKFTNNATLDVGTGGAFQVPPLVGVGWRTPLLHDGCAATLTDRFVSCATPAHGSTSTLSTANISDLVAYLETL
jgi:mono/diheme cytochrome c family protein